MLHVPLRQRQLLSAEIFLPLLIYLQTVVGKVGIILETEMHPFSTLRSFPKGVV